MSVAGQANAVVYTFDNANRLTNVTQGTSSVLIAYDNANRRTSLTLPNGVAVTYAYNNANELTSLTYKKGTTTLGTLTHTYDLAGRRITQDGTYARTGLPAAMSGTVFDANNRLTSQGATNFTYDLNGNLTNDGTNTYTWNARDQLTAISGAVAASFQYDAAGRRLAKTIAGATTKFFYDGINIIQELNVSNVATANLLTGLGIDEVYSRTDLLGTQSFLSDALGSTIAMADSAGAVAASYTYEPYGKASKTGTTSNTQTYTGREDDGTGLYYYRARYYHPTLSRFISEDPIGYAAGPNVYAYVDGNPISLADPFGLSPEFCAGKADVVKAVLKIILELALSLGNPDGATDPNRQRDKPAQHQQEQQRENDTKKGSENKDTSGAGKGGGKSPPPPRPWRR